jgi:hypothetical protein
VAAVVNEQMLQREKRIVYYNNFETTCPMLKGEGKFSKS